MYKALIDRESLVSSKILNDYEIIDIYEEYWQGEVPEILHISKVRVPEEKVDSFVKTLSSQELQDGWFALVWDEYKAIVIFKDKIFKLKNKNPWGKEELTEVIEYGRAHEIDEKYFLNMRSVMDIW
ncbi:MAG: hypothetical protein WAV98_01140 [Minisyncoccia bacterium]